MGRGKYKKALQGIFKPKNPLKYEGTYPIVYRSGLEKRVMIWLDSAPNIIGWSSESLVIPYYNPVKQRQARYFPDFQVKYQDSKGDIRTSVIEIKSASETRQPVKKARVTRRLVEDIMTWETNKAKWRHAEKYCQDRGWEFKVLTEHDLGVSHK